MTKPGGMLAVTIPTATSEHLYLRVGDDYFESPGGHIRIFRPRQLAEGLAAAGLATVGVGFAHALHTPYWVLRSIAAPAARRRERAGARLSPLPDPGHRLAGDDRARERAQLLLPEEPDPLRREARRAPRKAWPAWTRPLRICFVAYRGNMRCGGQGVYLWFLARELARLGHSVDVFVGPPYPDPMPFARSVSS